MLPLTRHGDALRRSDLKPEGEAVVLYKTTKQGNGEGPGRFAS
jgi:hypothetical protein